jgi:hypothetical protein
VGGTGSREENALRQKTRASVLIQSEPILLCFDDAAVLIASLDAKMLRS